MSKSSYDQVFRIGTAKYRFKDKFLVTEIKKIYAKNFTIRIFFVESWVTLNRGANYGTNNEERGEDG